MGQHRIGALHYFCITVIVYGLWPLAVAGPWSSGILDSPDTGRWRGHANGLTDSSGPEYIRIPRAEREQNSLTGAFLKNDKKKRDTAKALHLPKPVDQKPVSDNRRGGSTRAPEMRRTCSQVPFSQEKTCTRRVVKQKSYSCPSDFFPEVCVEKERQVTVGCKRLSTKEIEFECPTMTSKTICYKMPRTVPSICTRKVSKFSRRPCPKKVQEYICRTKAVQVQETCPRSVTEEVTYPCEKVQSRLECDVQFRVEPATCTREIDVPITYEYETTETERHCRLVKKFVKKTCSKPVMVEETYPCPKKVIKPKCEQVTEDQVKTCTETRIKNESYSCQNVVVERRQSNCTRLAVKREQQLQIRHDQHDKNRRESVTESSVETYPCEKNVPVVVPALCTRDVPYEASFPCSEKVVAEKCLMSEETIAETCTRQVARDEEYACEDVAEVEECEDNEKKIMQTGVLRVDSRTEQYDCDKSISAENCTEFFITVPATCVASIMKTVDDACTRGELHESCEVVEKVVEGTCIEEETIDEEYVCPQLEYDEVSDRCNLHRSVENCRGKKLSTATVN
ncbi:putative toxoplasma gondii family D protein [Toxoplasma gondii TgCatPRC2]|uniref:Toxoplasma gondii family D protein n=3 Tax=Toxoplasma gondii TaxID=5811 RepID=S8EZM1_TOXGM|nr:hypothetical protein TGME49_287960 [Toxoplasma gondii ME49]EPT27812.1 hypothetical protein TGME49_287960 [Toxoplasma gondii ME49]KYF45316.1 putative toxoplasma gondii family D protein [Toxoplasma gondii ARI]KYK69376.1 putative toxoplasma gondii family D protein [Toxoplasma gondii TgCatPRC2]|eukprot:XP_018636338.1 hypothetical protein TGME49_287960 [Toxoplasma gondii ME49]